MLDIIDTFGMSRDTRFQTLDGDFVKPEVMKFDFGLAYLM
jgi:hypothetical protein